MPDERTQTVLAQCEQNGLAWAKVFIEGQENSHYGLDVRYWIADRERKEQDAREFEQKRLFEATVSEARDAAAASRKSAHWTMIAGIAAAASAVISAAVPIATAAGWLAK